MAGKSLDEITGEIVDAAYKLHRVIGPGLLESVYEIILLRDLERRGLRAARQTPVSFEYDGMLFRDVCRIDLLVKGCVAVELKSVERLAPVHPKQLLTYLRLRNLSVGLLINFGAPTLKDGLRRVVNALPSSASPRESNSRNKLLNDGLFRGGWLPVDGMITVAVAQCRQTASAAMRRPGKRRAAGRR